MVYLKAWYRDVIRQQQAPSDDLATVLDHGPIYRLAMRGEFGPDLTKNPLYARWWDTLGCCGIFVRHVTVIGLT